MQILWRLVLAHLLADFTLQTNFIAEWKRRTLAGSIVHSLLFFVCAALLCSSVFAQPWLTVGGASLRGWEIILLLTFLHFAEDEWRMWSIQKLRSADSFLFFLIDQVIHLGLIFAFFPGNVSLPAEKWVLLAVIGILATHALSIGIYFLDKDIFGSSDLLSRDRYYSMGERLLTCLALLLPGLWPLCVVALWLCRMPLVAFKKNYSFSWFNILAGNGAALVLGLVARRIFYGA